MKVYSLYHNETYVASFPTRKDAVFYGKQFYEDGNHWTAVMRTDVEQWTTYSQMWNEDPQQPVKL